MSNQLPQPPFVTSYLDKYRARTLMGYIPPEKRMFSDIPPHFPYPSDAPFVDYSAAVRSPVETNSTHITEVLQSGYNHMHWVDVQEFGSSLGFPAMDIASLNGHRGGKVGVFNNVTTHEMDPRFGGPK